MHPMYIENPPTVDLFQGDLINREKLIDQGALKGHQDYVAGRDEFCGFCVITQSCDLVRGRCADFITMAVMRKIGDVFESAAKSESTTEKLRRLINHNDDKLGYFYLHREPSIGIGDGAVVDLRAMFSLRATLHYDELRNARSMSLRDVYANKLGWMAGHLFSRVPMRDWHELGMPETEQQAVTRLLEVIKRRPGPKLPFEKPF
jgi:hypothetical protein